MAYEVVHGVVVCLQVTLSIHSSNGTGYSISHSIWISHFSFQSWVAVVRSHGRYIIPQCDSLTQTRIVILRDFFIFAFWGNRQTARSTKYAYRTLSSVCLTHLTCSSLVTRESTFRRCRLPATAVLLNDFILNVVPGKISYFQMHARLTVR